jgi:glycosyltransferase involved in cell wall biosynthesis
MIRVLHCITSLDIGGAERALLELCTALDRRRFSSSVVFLTGAGALEPRFRQVGVPTRSAGMRAVRPRARDIATLFQFGRAIRPDIIHGWMYHGNLSAHMLAAGVLRVPVLWNVRHSAENLSTDSLGTRRIIALGASLSRLPKAIVYNATSSARAHEVIGYAPKKTIVIPNGFDHARFRPDSLAGGEFRREVGVPGDAPLVGIVARNHPAKDLATFLTAANLIGERLPNVHFVLCGPGLSLLEPPQGTFPGLSIPNRLHVLEARADVERLYAALDLFVLTSVSESFPNVLGEAMATGVPCVTTAVGDAPDIVGDTGRVVQPRDPHAVAEAALTLLRESMEQRERRRVAVRNRICALYPIEQVAGRYERLYEHILGHNAL